MNIINKIEGLLEIIKRPVYLWLALIPYLIYLVALVGLVNVNQNYLDHLKSFTQIIIAVILMIRFNPLKPKHELREYDDTIIFGSAIILLTNASVTENVIDYVKRSLGF
jgi:hypothetical protein